MPKSALEGALVADETAPSKRVGQGYGCLQLKLLKTLDEHPAFFLVDVLGHPHTRSQYIADALANNRGIIARFRLGVLPPDVEDTSHCREVFDQLCRSTDAQIAALEAFAAINWRG